MERQLIAVLNRIACGSTPPRAEIGPAPFGDNGPEHRRSTHPRGYIQHVVCTMRSAGTLRDELSPRVKLVSLNMTGRRSLAAIKLAALLRRCPANVIHARNWNTWTDCVLANRLAGNPSTVVLGFHGRETDAPFARADRRRARWLGLHRQRFTAVSHAGRDQLTHELGVNENLATLLRNGVDTALYAPPTPDQREAARQHFGIRSREFVVLMLASLTPVKDHRTAFAAMASQAARIPNCRLLVAGDGPLRFELEELALRFASGFKTTFVGHQTDPQPLLHAADLLLCSSRYEQMSNALLEAMACGLPIVATDVGDNARIVEHEVCGLICKRADPCEMGRTLLRCAAGRELRVRLGQRARRRVADEYAIDRTAAAYHRFYGSLLGEAGREAFTCAALPALSRTAP